MKRIAETLGVARSNLVERAGGKRRIGRKAAHDLPPRRKPLTFLIALPTYRRIRRPARASSMDTGITLTPRAAERIKGGNELHERIDIPTDYAVACLHPLNGRQRQPGRFRELALVYPE